MRLAACTKCTKFLVLSMSSACSLNLLLSFLCNTQSNPLQVDRLEPRVEELDLVTDAQRQSDKALRSLNSKVRCMWSCQQSVAGEWEEVVQIPDLKQVSTRVELELDIIFELTSKGHRCRSRAESSGRGAAANDGGCGLIASHCRSRHRSWHHSNSVTAV